MPRDSINDIADSYVLCTHINLAVESSLRHFQSDFLACRHRYGVYRSKCAFEFPDISMYFLCDIAGHFIADIKAAEMRLFLHDCDSRFVARRVNSCYQSPVEPADETFFERWYLDGRAVGAEDDLFAAAVEGIKRVEELLLALLCFTQKLHIVNNKSIHRAEPALEAGQVALFDCLYETVYEFLTA